MADVAFLELGNMGSGMASNLVKAGFTVRGFDLMPEALKRSTEAGVEPAKSVAQAVRGAAAVVTMLPSGREVRTVYEEIFASASVGTLMLDCSTIDVATARAIVVDAE